MILLTLINIVYVDNKRSDKRKEQNLFLNVMSILY